MDHIKLGWRQLTRRPGLSFVVIVMLALGIGATTAMFSLYHQILVRPLPVPEPERLVNFASPAPGKMGYRDLAIGDFQAQFSYPIFRDLEVQQTGFTGLAGHSDFVANVTFREQPTYSRGGALVSGNYFRVLNLKPAIGRLIVPEDEPQVGESAVVVLSYDYWQRRFGGNPNVIGELLTVNGQQLEIIGVAPEGFTGTTLGVEMDLFVPLSLRWLMVPTLGHYNPQAPSRFFDNWVYIFGRLEPGVTLEQAAAQLNGHYAALLEEVEASLRETQVPQAFMERLRQQRIALSPGELGWGPLRERAARPLALLLGVTALVLLIVCVNIANLLLARGASRSGEMAIRASIGASRGVLVRQLLAESFVLIAIGGAASLLVAMLIGREDLGIEVDSLVTFGITAQLSSYDQAELLVLYDRIEEALAAEPGVRAVGTTAIPLFYDYSLGGNFAVEGVEVAPGADTYAVATAVGSGYFDTLDIPLLSGRAFTDLDNASSQPVAIVNEAFVRKWNLGDQAVGTRLRGGPQPIEIVGVVGDTKHASVRDDIPPLVYFPRRQRAGWLQSLWVYVRGNVEADELKGMVPRVMAEVAPDVPLVIVQTMRERLNDNLYIDRLLTTLSAGFAALATLLAGIGLYGVLSYGTQQRTRELGLRLALGAEPRQLRALVLKQVGVMATIGLGVGLAAALALGAAAEAVLFGLSGRDPAVIGWAVVMLGAVILAASWLPAWNASRIAPIEALRYE